ncbi:MAG: hypothetical protein LC687_04840, partial [Actinobacteria bacterium]|nr:hypothetical protein [Actinomycetota bacterium]
MDHSNRLILSPDQNKLLVQAAGLRIRHSSGSSVRCSCPFHSDKNPSFSINLKAGVYFCHSCKASGTLPQLVYELTGKGARSYLGDVGGEMYKG